MTKCMSFTNCAEMLFINTKCAKILWMISDYERRLYHKPTTYLFIKGASFCPKTNTNKKLKVLWSHCCMFVGRYWRVVQVARLGAVFVMSRTSGLWSHRQRHGYHVGGSGRCGHQASRWVHEKIKIKGRNDSDMVRSSWKSDWRSS